MLSAMQGMNPLMMMGMGQMGSMGSSMSMMMMQMQMMQMMQTMNQMMGSMQQSQMGQGGCPFNQGGFGGAIGMGQGGPQGMPFTPMQYGGQTYALQQSPGMQEPYPQQGYPQQSYGGGYNQGGYGGMQGGYGVPMGYPRQGLAHYRPHGNCGCNFPQTQANPGTEIPECGGANPSKGDIDQMLNSACEKYGVPPQIAKAVAYQESSWNPKAHSFDGGHGKGIMQIDDRSHSFAQTDQVWDPSKNIEYGVKMLAQNYQKTGDWHTAIRKYNGSGPAAENYANRVTSLANQEPWKKWGVA